MTERLDKEQATRSGDMKLTGDQSEGSLLDENGELDCDVFDEEHAYVEPDGEPPDWVVRGLVARHGVTGLALASNHQFEQGVLSDVAIVFRRDGDGSGGGDGDGSGGGDGDEVSVYLDPEFSALLAVTLMKRVHPSLMIKTLGLVAEAGMEPNNDAYRYEIIKVPESLDEMPEEAEG